MPLPPDVPTHVRWCQKNLDWGIDCNNYFAHRDARLFTDSQCAPSVACVPPDYDPEVSQDYYTTDPDQLQPRRLRSNPGGLGAWQWSAGPS